MKELIAKGTRFIKRNIGKYIRKATPLPKPLFVSISPTNKCNLSCKMCEIWKISHESNRAEMTTEEMKKAITDLHGWLGKFTINFAGGEPFMRKDMIEIFAYATEKGLDVYTTSNGVLLTDEKCNELVKSGLRGISISLDSTNPEIHNHIRNTKNGHEKTTGAISFLNNARAESKQKMDLNISTVFMGYNLSSIIPLLDFVEKNKLTGINYQPLIHNFGTEYKPHWYKSSDLWPKESQLDEVDAVIDELIRRKKAGSPIHNPVRQLEMMKKYFRNPVQHAKDVCNVGNKNFAVSEYGEVLICYFFEPIGNIKESKPEELWTSLQAKAMRQRISKCQRNCDLLNCNFD